MDVDTVILIRTIDEFIINLGTSGIVDARKARDQLLDLRLLFMNKILEPSLISPVIEGPDTFLHKIN